MSPRIQRFVGCILLLASLQYAVALKGQDLTPRSLQDAGGEKDTPSKAPKEAKGDSLPKAEKEKKVKKCVKQPKAAPPPASAPSSVPEEPADETDTSPDEDEPVCIQFDASAENCRAAQNGQGARGSSATGKRVQGNVEMDISYPADTTAEVVLGQVEEIYRSTTAADFLGCTDEDAPTVIDTSGTWNRRSQEAEPAPAVDDVKITGVDFEQVKLAKGKDCESTDASMNCDTIQSKVSIYYEGEEELSDSEERELLNLLVATIETQAAEGDFTTAGQIESVEVESLSAVTSENGSASGSANNAPQWMAVVAIMVSIIQV